MSFDRLWALPYAAPVFWTLFAILAGFGLVALVSPRLFQRLAQGSSRWVDTSQIVAKLDSPIDIDAKVLPHCRILGAAVLGSLAFLAFVIL